MDGAAGGVRMGVTRRRLMAGGVAVAALPVAAGTAACGVQPAQPGGQALKPATVRYLHFDTGQPVWQENWGKIFSSFEEKNPGVKVERDLVTQALTNVSEKAVATYAGGGTYELFYGHFTILSTFLGANIVEPLDGFLAKDREVKVDDYHASATERMKGKLYGIAWFAQGKEIFYNADMLAEAGAANPRQLEKEGRWTWDALLDVARKVAKTDGSTTTVYGFNTGFGDIGTFVNNVYAWGGDLYDKGFAKPTFDSAQFLGATQFAVDMVARHRVSGGGNFQQKSLAMLLGSGSSTRGWDEQIVRANLFKIEHTMLPKGPAGRPSALSNNCLYLGKNAKAPDAAWAFNKHLVGKDCQPMVAQLGGGRYSANKKVKPVTLFAFEDAAVYEASAAIVKPTPLIVKQADLQKDWAEQWKDMTEGKRGVRDALTLMQEKAALYLKEGCIC